MVSAESWNLKMVATREKLTRQMECFRIPFYTYPHYRYGHGYDRKEEHRIINKPDGGDGEDDVDVHGGCINNDGNLGRARIGSVSE